ncbi:hypothetical protein G5V57_18105 [Nordella sp. HKS 07]|uniref:hypothetical protein n=1 Tax=Nordella sp. HKS 07 TaxID=2712222 RepID=UPI0013E1A3EA|nr:hypothetical protein [Nordella sp. HKS 07]QIG49460.1 hypothetical protein G5V57_18105 [Nordella sp. HKS 07]
MYMPGRIVTAILATSAVATPAWAQDAASLPAQSPWDGFMIVAALAGLILLVGWLSCRVTGLFVGVCYITSFFFFAKGYPAQPLNLEGMGIAAGMYVVALLVLHRVPMSRAVKIGIIALAVSSSWYMVRSALLTGLQNTAQRILDKEANNAIKIVGIDAPRMAFLPLIGPAEWQSFMLVGDKDGKLLDRPECPSVAEYQYKAVGSKYLVQLQTKELRECSSAMAEASK